MAKNGVLCRIMRLKLALCAVLTLLLCSCKPKQVAVGYGDDVYYREKTAASGSYPNYKSDTKSSSPSPAQKLTGDARALVDEAYSWIGTPYSYGSHSRRGTDCSGFVMEVYRRALGFTLPRSTSEQSEACTDIDRDDLRAGDLVFFRDRSHGKIAHVGIYIGNGKFVHASSSRGVIESSLTEKYYDDHYRHSGRIKGLKLK